MGLIKNGISISSKNGYSVDKYWIARDYLSKVSNNRRNLDTNELIDVYNKVKRTDVKIGSCKPCSVTKYYNGLQNYVKYAEILFKANGIDYSRHIEPVKEETVKEEPVKDEPVKDEPIQVDVQEIKPKKRVRKNVESGDTGEEL